jgi:DNA-binding transcriptional MerR regulator
VTDTPSSKSSGAFRTIGELSRETGIAQHILRYWETRFPQLRPVTRAGNRRYYRPDDVALVRRINTLLNEQGFTVRGAQQALAGDVPADAPPSLVAIRDRLARALAED